MFRSGQSEQDVHGDVDLEEVLRLSLEEYKESQKELLSSLSVQPAYQTRGEADAYIVSVEDASQGVGAMFSSSSRHSSMASAVMDNSALQDLCSISHTGKLPRHVSIIDTRQMTQHGQPDITDG